MSFFKSIFTKRREFPNLLEECYSIIREIEDEQERTFEGMVELFREDNKMPPRELDNEFRFKARILGGVMIPFTYANMGYAEKGYNDLMRLAFHEAMIDRHGVRLFPMETGLLIGERFIVQNMSKMAEEHRAGTLNQRFAQILCGILDECTVKVFNQKYDISRYAHFITGNINTGLSRAAATFRS